MSSKEKKLISIIILIWLVGLLLVAMQKQEKVTYASETQELIKNTNQNDNITISSADTNASNSTSEVINSCANSKQQVFNENLKTIKDAAISYFTNERLPKKVGDSVKLTLSEMQKEKIVLDVIDSNNSKCSTSDSYVLMTKEENEYLMKINLSCNDMEDYILIHLGCYDYCKDNICEKQEDIKEFEYELLRTLFLSLKLLLLFFVVLL